jgi:hypothetical protein
MQRSKQHLYSITSLDQALRWKRRCFAFCRCASRGYARASDHGMSGGMGTAPVIATYRATYPIA